jgi:hypothetical protein
MNYEIKHQPIQPNAKSSVISIDQVDQLYIGLGNNCRCGCGGKYIKPDSDENIKIIEKVLAKMARGKVEVSSQDDYIFEIVVRKWEDKHGYEQNRVECLYLKK